jgi:hypothetical protein
MATLDLKYGRSAVPIEYDDECFEVLGMAADAQTFVRCRVRQ